MNLLRRASARSRLDGLARVEYAERTHNVRIADVSFGGLGLLGDALRVPGRTAGPRHRHSG
jgi:hypothetical protein